MKRNRVSKFKIITVLTCLYVALFSAFPGFAKDCLNAQKVYHQAVNQRDFQKREHLYRQAIALCPDYAEAHNNLADALEQQGKYDQAVVEYHKAIKLKPNLAVPYLSLGDIYLKMGLFQKSVAYYKEGLKRDPDDALAVANLTIANQGILTAERYNLLDSSTLIESLKDRNIRTMGPGGVRAKMSRVRFQNILFNFDSYSVKPQSIPQLYEIGRALSSHKLKNARFLIEGHTDSIGSEDYNQKLSENRAMSIKLYLINNFPLHENVLDVRGYGEVRPLTSNATDEDRKNNRRVEIVAISR